MKRTELIDNIRRKGSFLCVGLDPDMKKIPSHLLKEENPIFAFNKAIIDATAPYAVAYKPNLAFYESEGIEGMKALDMTVKYIKDNYPDQFVIADAKRGDIGNTAAMYARSLFETLGADAVTVAPYMGADSVTPFTDYADKWTILLALTSNKGYEDFELMEDKHGHRLFERVIFRSQRWGTPVNLMYVVGATRGELIADVRKVAPRNFLLVPGVGAQGGSLEEVVRYGLIPDECGLLVNSSRGIIYASSGEDFAQAAGKAAEKLAKEMSQLLSDNGFK
ncbi:MAG: orotidine-5'-phosphate decarboxylase [Muribaculaceae bacterium]|nr:orotidine-5'-phosphate decarboxylase [Muribaculaceae bacterium]MDE5929560.1 orotidine-5'-phosphate decarboxylase [Muribaculaceae bacterium]